MLDVIILKVAFHDLDSLLFYQTGIMKCLVSYSCNCLAVLSQNFFQNVVVWSGAPSMYDFTSWDFFSSYTSIFIIAIDGFSPAHEFRCLLFIPVYPD